MSPVVVTLVASITAACGSTYNDGAGGSAGSAGSAGAGGTAGGGGASGSGGNGAAPNCAARCGAPGCPGCAGPSMIDATPQQFAAYRIDSTEVTNAHYAEFLAASPASASQPVECAWNTDFAPESALPNVGCAGDLYDPVGRANHPVVCVDWCDARAYCEWAGKRLCLGAGGTPTGGDPAAEWVNACSAEWTQSYPYGNVHNPAACNGDQPGTGALLSVGSLSTCEGALPGLFDMSGNASEWMGTCNGDGPDALCNVPGGSYAESTDSLKCFGGPTSVQPRSTMNSKRGFRCCADAID